MSKTDELRRLLDERGVEWVGTDFAEPTEGHPTNTTLGSEYHDAVFIEYTDGSVLRLFDLTPEQAITATLGNRTCHKLPASGEKTCIVRHNSTHLTMEFGYWKCSECGCECFEGARYCMNCGAKVEGA